MSGTEKISVTLFTTAIQQVITRTAIKNIRTFTSIKAVITFVAMKCILALVTMENVIAAIAVQQIISRVSANAVVSGATMDDIFCYPALKTIIFLRTADFQGFLCDEILSLHYGIFKLEVIALVVIFIEVVIQRHRIIFTICINNQVITFAAITGIRRFRS